MEKIYLGWLFIAGAVLALLPVAYMLFKAIKSKGWPTRMAMITYNSLAVKKAGYWQGRTALGGDLIKYRYNVERVDYTGNQITAADLVIKLMVASDGVLEHYPEQTMIEVAYNPNKPHQALLQPGLTRWNLIPLITISIFFAAGYALINGLL
ncbi:DUF3592 domain-containing protein [Motilimonas pumila]|uniref:DUF3592 domain-containing protein n=1 Tax=Motilimonas pumila TaxID=2303987 RepID=A0A418YHM3_9GAMM|nr:DUF3592 domain-containing protein [Motilimonas pumila]RJG49878.1 DUF3592 domain-containing protein [Motilimonas pumila]